MPRPRRYLPAEVMLVHKGVVVYYVYKYNDRDELPREFGFDTREYSQDDCSYDVREVADQLGIDFEVGILGSTTEDELIALVICAGIDKGLVKY